MNFLYKKSFQSVRESTKKSNLRRTLGGFDLILLGLGAIIGTGVFALTGLVAAKHSGPAVTISYAIAGATCILVALVYTEIATMLPTSGGVYAYSYVAFGEVFAWLMGSIIIIELGFTASAVSISWSSYMQGMLSSLGFTLPNILSRSFLDGGFINLPAVIIVFITGVILYTGTRESKKLNNILVLVKLTAIAIFIFCATPHFDATNWEDFMPFGVNGVMFGSSILFFAFTGFTTLASVAEECKDPKKDLTIGLVGAVLVSAIIYIIVGAVLTGIAPLQELNNAHPLAHALHINGNNIGSVLVATGAIAGMTTVIMVSIYAQSRIFYVIARDGLLPKALTKVHKKYGSPSVTIGLFTLLVAIIGGFGPYSVIASLSSMGALFDYIVITLIALIFRFKYRHVERPFRCPAIFIIAPLAFFIATYLLSKQIIDTNNDLLLTGKIFICWFPLMFILYVLSKFLSKNNPHSS